MKFKPILFPNGDSGLEIDISDLEMENKDQFGDALLFRMKSYGIINSVSTFQKKQTG